MQHNEPNKFARLWKEKGYYILLSLCVVAVGVSGYFFLTGASEEQQAVQESLSVPVTVEEVPEEPKKPQTRPAVSEVKPVEIPVEAPLTVMPVSGNVTRDYAMEQLTYNATTRDWRVHNGVDLAAAVGSEVKAAKAGTVTAVYEDEFLGATVVIGHDGGYTTHYSNLAADPMVAAGDTVAAGDVIGLIGQTALIETAEEPHLHFEVYANGEPTNPAGFLY